MTEAEKLLQETKSAVVVAESQTEDICVIDSDLRIIGIPEQFKVLGVEHDKDVKVMQFRIPKVYKGTDLSAFNISINYQNARGAKDRYVVTDKRASGDQIEFSWTVGSTAVKYKGDTRFIVCMRLTDSGGAIEKEFNTTLATMTILEGLEVDNPVIEREEKDIIAQLLQIVDDKSKEAVQAVTAEGAKQIKAVQDAAQEVIADREQIKTNKADIADLRQKKAGAIINSAKRERIAVGDSADAFFEGLKLYGKSEQNGSPTPDNPIPIKSCGDGGKIGIEVSGKNLLQESKIKRSKDNVYLFNDNNGFLVKKNENYALSFSNVANAIFLIEIGKNSSDAIKKVTNDKKLTFTATEDMNVYFNIYIPGASESITNIQFEYAKDPTNYEEMKSIQSMSVPTPNGLPGIKVDSGGNYTDSNGQQWICDEMDFKRGKYVQRIKKMVLNDTGWWLTTKDKYQAFGLTADNNKGNIAGMCDKFTHIDIVSSSIGFNTKTKGRIYLTTGHETLEELKAWLKENPVTVVYALATPIETNIPEETMTAYRKLYTNYPSTVIQNDSGAGMEVEYVADTKQFILDQIKALVQA
ncbi:hypothetical protein [Mediterraneibacter gnavus]|uniref:hypothetical protein n=3 Tax=Mediterraneibacter gnavus TaxID=33038 RepID=UPI0032D9216A